LTVEALCQESREFSAAESVHPEPALFGVTDGKAVGTYLENKFRAHLIVRGYAYEAGNSASGLDFPELNVDIKTTSIKQPQSSCPFRSVRQRVFGLGYSLLVFVYEKTDDHESRSSALRISDTIFIEASRTSDFQMTRGLRKILAEDGNEEDIMAFLAERSLATDEHELRALAAEVFKVSPEQGYLTISPALQWRLQYRRAIEQAGSVDGILSVFKG
jgi:hypothetical protein